MIAEKTKDTFAKMDGMYRYQRYFYDATRKYYLLGRDRLLDKLDVLPGQQVLEVGCGTGRNLEVLSQRFETADFFGLDASAEMLESAAAKVKNTGVGNITLKKALADDFNYALTFGLSEPFDHIFFSYSISMIPTWRESIANAFANLRPGGSIYIVDFYDQAEMPAWFRASLRGWLRQFGVTFWPDLIDHLAELKNSGRGDLVVESVYNRYAFIAILKKKLDLNAF